MKKVFLISLFVFWSVPAGANVAAVSPSWTNQVEKARSLESEGQYTEALQVYETLLIRSDLTKEQLQKLRVDYESLNLKVLFSRHPMSNSTIHKVMPGDSLYKVARRYGTTVGLLKRSNGLKSDTIHPGMKLKAVTGTFSIRIDRSANLLGLYLDEKPLKHYFVATGEGETTPLGEFIIKNKLVDPTWYTAGAVLSPDSPDNILGTRWMGFDYTGYGIHGTTQPETIGKHASAGCVRMLNEDVEELYDIVPVGTKVVVVD